MLQGLEDTFGPFARGAQCGTGLAVAVAKGLTGHFNKITKNYQQIQQLPFLTTLKVISCSDRITATNMLQKRQS